MRRMWLCLLLLITALCLCGCSVLLEEDAQVLPDLRLLERPEYADEVMESEEASANVQQTFKLDLWLDASQTMGGINTNEESMYPHHGVRYREGGFHYQYEDQTGWYHSLLGSMLKAVEGSRVRLLRYGNERLPDEYLLSQGVADEAATAEEYRSLRRDMLTYAIDPMPAALDALVSEKMDESFYALGSPMLNQMEELRLSMLENPESAQSMSEALTDQIDAIEDERDDRLTVLANDTDYPLLYALDNLDLTRLSVITCDPASIRRLNAVSADGSPAALIQEMAEKRGVFDAGLTVGLYAFELDYMGQLSSFGSADLSEPLIWGELKYSNGKGRIEAVLPMPRTLLTLVIGTTEQVEGFTARLNAQLASDPVYAELRGPEKQELTYTRDGETVTQEPFGFHYEYMQITRPVLKAMSHHIEGAVLSAPHGTVDNETRLVSLAKNDPVKITVSVPVEKPKAVLADLSVSVTDALLLEKIIPNAPDASTPEDAQVIALRDKLYIYRHQESGAAFRVAKTEADGDALVFTLTSDKPLEPGYYHLHLSADYAAGAVTWETEPWVSECSATLSNEQISTWETFTSLMATHERKRENIARTFQHAWGPASDGKYHGMAYPDCPPVYKAPGLSELVKQLQRAADLKQSPCLRYTFDIFVDNR